MQKAVEIFVFINCAVVGISHTFAPRAWGVFFEWLHSKGEAGAFVNAFLSLWFGSVIVAFHPVWSGWPLVVTLLGCAQVLKGLIHFTFPRYGVRQLARVRQDNPHLIRWAGVAFLGFTAWLGWQLLRG